MNAVRNNAQVDAAIDAVKGRQLPGTVKALAFAGIVWGIGAFGYGLTWDKKWTWGAFLVALVYTFAVAQGGVAFGVIMQGTQGRWGRPLKRVAESFGFFLPVAWLLLVAFLIFGLPIYPWNPGYWGTPTPIAPHMVGAPAAKEVWLNPLFFQVRTALAVAFLIFLDFLFIRNSLGPDLVLAKQRLGDAAPSWWNFLIAGRTDGMAAGEAGLASNYTLVPFIGFTYAIVMSLIGFDLIMSLDPWWVSNMFGGWTFMSSLLMGFSTLAVFVTVGRDWLGLKSWVKPKTTHDLGRFMLAGTMFWAYTLYAQILPIYYTNVPEETSFLLTRLMLPQWGWLARTVAVLCFIAPFTILLSRGIKKMRYPFAGVALLSLTGFFLERSLLILPSVYFGDTFPTVQFLIINVGIFAGFIGLFVLVVGGRLAQVPAVPVADPLLFDHPWDEHVHAFGSHHGH